MTKINRRQLMKGVGASLLAAPMINRGVFAVTNGTNLPISVKAKDLVDSSLVVDALSVMRPLNNLYPKSPTDNTMAITDEQVAKLRSTGTTVWHPAVGFGGFDAQDYALKFFGALNARVAERPDVFTRIDSADDLARVKASGKMGLIVGAQNSDHFHSPNDVNGFYHLGQRISQLTYNSQNFIGTGSTDRGDSGISSFGAMIVERMNEVGMAVDVSHCGDQTTLDAFALSKKPAVITHSNVRALAGGHVRCKSDEAIKAMAKAGSVMGITGVRMFVKESEPTDLNSLLDHYDYVRDMAGIEHVGIGSDMDPDGYDDMEGKYKNALKAGYSSKYGFRDKIDTDGYDSPKKIYHLVDGLIGRGYTDEHIRLVLGENFRRVLSEIWG